MKGGNHTGHSLNGCPIGSRLNRQLTTSGAVPRVKTAGASVKFSASARLSSAREGGAVLPAPLNSPPGAGYRQSPGGVFSFGGGVMHFHVGRYDEAVELVKRHHYSRRAPSNVQCVGTLHDEGGLFGDYGDAVAACFFSLPPTRWSEEVWELSRLVRTDRQIPLTGLIAQTCRAAKAKGADLLVSFADRTQGHHGGIYQAASWNYAGCRDRRMDGVVVDGRFVPGRSANSTWGTQSPSKLTDILRKEVLPHYDEGKHLYWRAMTKEGSRRAARLGLSSLPYPKPNLQKVAAE